MNSACTSLGSHLCKHSPIRAWLLHVPHDGCNLLYRSRQHMRLLRLHWEGSHIKDAIHSQITGPCSSRPNAERLVS